MSPRSHTCPLVGFGVVALLAVGAVIGTPSAAHADSPLTGEMKKIDGKVVDLGNYKGKVVLVVNVASRCGYTGQYAGLQKLYDAYKDKGFVILGFPANEFGAQEPGTDPQIAEFCSSKYGVTFDMFSKIVVKGPGKAALYKALTEGANPPGEVSWNFEKFLIGRDGKIVGRFKSPVAPDDAKLTGAIEAELGK
ncbi:MAG: glutathione peroxidase [Planctomycetaceae bacterium]